MHPNEPTAPPPVGDDAHMQSPLRRSVAQPSPGSRSAPGVTTATPPPSLRRRRCTTQPRVAQRTRGDDGNPATVLMPKALHNPAPVAQRTLGDDGNPATVLTPKALHNPAPGRAAHPA